MCSPAIDFLRSFPLSVTGYRNFHSLAHFLARLGMVSDQGVNQDCGVVLKSLAGLGDAPRCVWPDLSHLTIYLSPTPTIMPDETITFINTVTSSDGHDLGGEVAIVVQLPDVVLPPQVSVIGATKISDESVNFFTIDLSTTLRDGLRQMFFEYYVKVLTVDEFHREYPDEIGDPNDGYSGGFILGGFDQKLDGGGLDDGRLGLDEDKKPSDIDPDNFGDYYAPDADEGKKVSKRSQRRLSRRDLDVFNPLSGLDLQEETNQIMTKLIAHGVRPLSNPNLYLAIVVTGTNFLNESSTETSHFVFLDRRGGGRYPVTLILANGTRTIHEDEAITFTANSTFITASDTPTPTPLDMLFSGDAEISYHWSLSAEFSPLDERGRAYSSGVYRDGDNLILPRSIVQNANIFRLPAYLLPAGRYRVSVRATATFTDDASQYETEASVRLVVDAARGVKILGGSKRNVGARQETMVIAFNRFDLLSMNLNDCSDCQYSWRCKDLADNTPCPHTLGSFVTRKPEASFAGLVPGSYLVTVHDTFGFSDSLELVVEGAVEAVPEVMIEATSTDVVDPLHALFHKFATDQFITLRVRLKDEKSGNMIQSVVWSSRDFNLVAGAPGVLSTNVNEPVIQLDPRHFAAEGAGFVFQVRVLVVDSFVVPA